MRHPLSILELLRGQRNRARRAGPLDAEHVVVLGGQAALAPGRFIDRLSDGDGGRDAVGVLGRDRARCDLVDERLLGGGAGRGRRGGRRLAPLVTGRRRLRGAGGHRTPGIPGMTGPDDHRLIVWPAPRLPPATVVPAGAPRLDPEAGRPPAEAAARCWVPWPAAEPPAAASGRPGIAGPSAVSVALTAGAVPPAEGAAAVVPGMSASAAAGLRGRPLTRFRTRSGPGLGRGRRARGTRRRRAGPRG